MLFEGNERNIMLHAHAATLRGLTYFISFYGLFNVISGNHRVQNFPWGRGSGL